MLTSDLRCEKIFIDPDTLEVQLVENGSCVRISDIKKEGSLVLVC